MLSCVIYCGNLFRSRQGACIIAVDVGLTLAGTRIMMYNVHARADKLCRCFARGQLPMLWVPLDSLPAGCDSINLHCCQEHRVPAPGPGFPGVQGWDDTWRGRKITLSAVVHMHCAGSKTMGRGGVGLLTQITVTCDSAFNGPVHYYCYSTGPSSALLQVTAAQMSTSGSDSHEHPSVVSSHAVPLRLWRYLVRLFAAGMYSVAPVGTILPVMYVPHHSVTDPWPDPGTPWQPDEVLCLWRSVLAFVP